MCLSIFSFETYGITYEQLNSFVTTLITSEDGRTENLYLIRSFDHTQSIAPDRFRASDRIGTPRSSRVNTNISLNTNVLQRSTGSKIGKGMANYEKAQDFEIWQVARAATAAEFYFEPLKLEKSSLKGGFIEFRDGGFSRANNPTKIGMQEIEGFRGCVVGTVVSVGTARKLNGDTKKAGLSSIPATTRGFAFKISDPEETHETMCRDVTESEYQYYRLNDPGGLQNELDEWEPKRRIFRRKEGGEDTIRNIEIAFNKWASRTDNTKQFQDCASNLVTCRRRRMNTRKWERYATASKFECQEGCDQPPFFDRHLFESHLSDHHSYQSHELDDIVTQHRRQWKYQAAPSR